MPLIFLNRFKITCLCFVGISFSLLASCKKVLDINSPESSAVAVFDEVWNVLDEHYALFPVKGLDWNNVYQEYRSQVTSDITNDALFRLISEMLERLKDGHVTLYSSSDTSTYQGFYTAFPVNFNYANLLKNYLKDDYKTSRAFDL